MRSKEAKESLAEASAKVRELDPLLSIMLRTSSVAEDTILELETAIDQVKRERGESIASLEEELMESEIQVVQIAYGLGQTIDNELETIRLSRGPADSSFFPLNYNLFMNNLQRSPVSETSQRFISQLINTLELRREDSTLSWRPGRAIGTVRRIQLGIYSPISDGRLGEKYSHIAVRPHFTSVLDDPEYGFRFNMGRHAQLETDNKTWMEMDIEVEGEKIPTEETHKLQQMEITCAFLSATIHTLEAS